MVKNTMITYKFLGRRGRLGNQLFQYATLYAIAKENGYEFGIPYECRNETDDYRDMCLADCFDNLSAADSKNFLPTSQIEEKTNLFIPEMLKIRDNVDIFGYFQTEKYFKKYRSELLKEFKFKKEIYQKCFDLKTKINNKIISVHMRFGDYDLFPDVYPRCSVEYYTNALALMPADAQIILFSDDREKASQFFKTIEKPYVVYDYLSKYEDLCLMSLCDYHIIANSSFSWWGAWLSESKKVVAPKKWYGSNPNAPKLWSDIYCENWEIL
jgi:hypothetical protein